MADVMNRVPVGCGERSEPHRSCVVRFVKLTAPYLIFCALPAFAADLIDPTQPPAGYGEAAQGREAPREAALQVSAVYLMGARPYALVDGQVVRVGDRLAGGRVIRIGDAGVWLKTAAGMRHLELWPGVKKTSGPHKMEKP